MLTVGGMWQLREKYENCCVRKTSQPTCIRSPQEEQQASASPLDSMDLLIHAYGLNRRGAVEELMFAATL